jgi:hypothetical protein
VSHKTPWQRKGSSYFIKPLDVYDKKTKHWSTYIFCPLSPLKTTLKVFIFSYSSSYQVTNFLCLCYFIKDNKNNQTVTILHLLNLFFVMCSGILWKWTVPTMPLNMWDMWWSHRDRVPFLSITTCPAEQSMSGCVPWWVIHGAGCMHTMSTHLSALCVPYQLHILCSRPSSAERRVPSHLRSRVRHSA